MQKKLTNVLWDLWCTASLVGIWPRFIEPHLIQTTKLSLPIDRLDPALKGIRILQFSDLHLQACTSKRFLNRLQKKINELSPDLIVFTGDFICYSDLVKPDLLKKFLNGFQAPLGCFAILGNHDYSQFVSLNSQGCYDLISHHDVPVIKGLKRLLAKKPIKRQMAERVKNIPAHEQLLTLLKETPFQLLHNETVQIKKNSAYLNITGLGEYMLGRCCPKTAFQNYKPNAPGIILAHNPDSIPALAPFPGDVVLSGHTHGGQINLPGIRDKFILIENPQFNRGLKAGFGKWIYINRGCGGVMTFRWFSPPELLLLTLEDSSCNPT